MCPLLVMKTDENGATVFSPRRGAELQTWSHWETPCGGIAGDAGGQGGGYLWCLRQPGVEWIHGNVQSIMPLCLCFEHPRGGAFIHQNTNWSQIFWRLHFKAGCFYEAGTSLGVWWWWPATKTPTNADWNKDQTDAFNLRPKHKRLN